MPASASGPARARGVGGQRVRRRARRLLRRARRLAGGARRRLLPGERLALLSLLLGCVALGALSFRLREWVPVTALVLPQIVGGFLLRTRFLLTVFVATMATVAAVDRARMEAGDQRVTPGSVLLLSVTALLVLLLNRSRRRLGVVGVRGDSMLVDLRERLMANGEVPALPRGWVVDTALRSANGESFSGDFVVACRSADGRELELALVDVSGKGLDAGTRALLLSGAFGGLLGAVPGEGFMAAANRYLLRQEWAEGFATAVHVVLDLVSGDYQVTSAGHPPVARFDAGSGRWSTLDAEGGPLLGVLEEPGFPGLSGHLDPGDALLLYTDGLVEAPGRDLAEGIDRLLGHADRLVADHFRGGAHRLVDRVRAGELDDRALVLLRRT